MNNKDEIVFIRKAAVNLLGNNSETEKFIEENISESFKDVSEKIHKEAFLDLKKGKGFENTEKIFEELKECVLESGKEVSKEEITEEIEKWLFGKKKSEASLFIRRYWFGERKAVLSAAAFLSSEKLEQKLLKLRKSLCRCFEEKKIAVSSPEQIFYALSGIDEKLVRNAQKQKWKKPIYKLWQFWAAVGFVILSIFAAFYINIQSEKNSEYNYYFRDCVLNWSDSNYSFKELEDSIEYDVSRNFGYMRKSIEKEGTIPVFKDYQNFIGTGYYSAEGELRRLSLTWEHLAYMGFGYRKIRISFVPGTEDEVPASMKLPITEAGRAIPKVTTVSTRDGITIYGVTDGRAVMVESANAEKRVRKLMFFKDGYWIEMDGLRMGAKDMGEFLEWLFEDEIELGRFENLKQ